MSTVAKNSGTDFERAPQGTHIARCYQVIDLGHQQITWNGKPKWQHKILLTFELLGEDKMKDGRPFAVNGRYTLSLSEQSQLRPLLESWRGRKFSEQEAMGFDVKNVLGAYCLMTVGHNTENGKTYVNILGLVALPKGSAKPSPVNPDVYFDLDKDDIKGLPEWLQNVIRKSQEYEKRNDFNQLSEIDVPFGEEAGNLDNIPF